MGKKRKIVVPPIDFHSGQKAILSGGSRFKVARCGRRFGKTMLATEWLGLMPGSALDGWPVAFFAPTYKILLDVWEDMKRTLQPITKRSNKSDMRIDLITGGKIDFWTLEDKNAGRSRKYKRLVIDEAAHARLLQEAWERAISPTLTDFLGEAWFISTPNGINYFHELYRKGDDPGQPDWQSWHLPTSCNPHIRPEEIERYREDLPELVFRQEYLAEFVTFGAGMIRPEMIVMEPAPRGLETVLGVDLAISEKQTADFTAIAALSRDPVSGILYLKEIERHRCSFNEILSRIKDAAARHRPRIIAIENVQFQAAVVQELARTTTLPVIGIRPDRDKVTRLAPVITRYERRLVRHDPAGVPNWFREELLAFPEGEHEDGCDALAHAYQALTTSIEHPLTMQVAGL